jgi:hypothetical protein
MDVHPKVEYISHGKFTNTGILYVENHKIVKMYEFADKSTKIIKLAK